MGWSLSKILKPVVAIAGVAAAPFTGGASLAITAAAVGSMAQDSSNAQAQKAANAAADTQLKAQVAAQEKLLADQVAAQKDLTSTSTSTTQAAGTVVPTTQPAQPVIVVQPEQSSTTNGAPLATQQVQAEPNYLLYAGIAGAVLVGLWIWKRKG